MNRLIRWKCLEGEDIFMHIILCFVDAFTLEVDGIRVFN